MWIRLRLDIGYRDLFFGVLFSIFNRRHTSNSSRLEQYWSQGTHDALACLSVRTCFDLLLSELALPQHSEILFSAVTIADMVRVAEHHGLVPVPVELTGTDFRIDMRALQRAVTPRSRILVVAHLCGVRLPMDSILEFAREHGLFVIEDRAQAWCEGADRGHEAADANLFSFGTIKTGSALGGALMRVRNPDLLSRLRQRAGSFPLQSQVRFSFRCIRGAVLKLLSTRVGFRVLAGLGRLRGLNVDEVLGRLTAGLPGEDLFSQLRQQPCAAVLGLLLRRLKTQDCRRIERRVENAQRVIKRLGLDQRQPELSAADHSYWLFPLRSDDPRELIEALRQAGFDSTQRGRLVVVSDGQGRAELSCPEARRLLEETVFLPVYPELPISEVERMCDVLVKTRSRTRPSP